jgi:hypothetical protein
MKLTGPDASAPIERTNAPLGRKVEKIHTDAAASLHRQCRFLDAVKDAGKVIGNRSHDETIEQGDVAARARAS